MSPLLWIKQQGKPESGLLLVARNLVLEAMDFIDERFSYGIPFYYYKTKPFAYICLVNKIPVIGLTNGAILDDPFQILSGNQKQVRHIILDDSVESKKEAIVFILRESARAIENKLEKNSTDIRHPRNA